MNKNDLRYLKTEKIIIDSFKECVYKHGFEKTTVAMICECGMISRNTFYLHYEDKYDLLNYLYGVLEEKMVEDLTEKIISDLTRYSMRDSVVWTYKGIEKNRELVTFLLKCSKEKMHKVLEKILIEVPLSKMIVNYYEVYNNIELKLIKTYLATAMVGYIDVWLLNYGKLSTESIIDLMEELCTVPIEVYFNHLLNQKNVKFVEKG